MVRRVLLFGSYRSRRSRNLPDKAVRGGAGDIAALAPARRAASTGAAGSYPGSNTAFVTSFGLPTRNNSGLNVLGGFIWVLPQPRTTQFAPWRLRRVPFFEDGPVATPMKGLFLGPLEVKSVRTWSEISP